MTATRRRSSTRGGLGAADRAKGSDSRLVARTGRGAGRNRDRRNNPDDRHDNQQLNEVTRELRIFTTYR
jgi:hypothetical protein